MRAGREVIVAAALLFGSVPVFAQSGPAPREDYQIVIEDVALRPGVETDLHATVFVNEDAPCNGRTVLAVAGFAHTAATFGPLAEALFDNAAPGQAPCRVVAVDFPGHGDSPAPAALPFGFLTLNDYAAALNGVLEGLPGEGLRLDAILAHSQGGLVVQMAQQQLVDAGSSLRDAYGIRDVTLLAPVPPAEVNWAFAAFAPTILSGFFVVDPLLGPHFAIPDFIWSPLFFSDLGFVMTPNAPSAAAVAANGYNAPEPFLSALELVGAFGAVRPSVDARIFAPEHGTALQIVTLEQDQIVRPEEGDALYAHLTGSTGGNLVVGGPLSVHDMHVSDPTALLAALAGSVRVR